MRGRIFALVLAVTPMLAHTSSAQGSSDSKQCEARQRGNPSQSGLDHRADPTTKGQKDCPPPIVYGHTTVSGSVYFDLNLDGIFEPDDEIGLAGWEVQVSGPVTMTVLTDGNGGYTISGLTPGNYTLCVIPPLGWNQTAPVSGAACVSGVGYSFVAPATVSDTLIPGFDFGYVSQ